MLTPQEALLVLANGKKIARKSWDTGYIYMEDGHILDDSGESFETDDFNDFLLYQEKRVISRCMAIMPGSGANKDGTFWVVCDNVEEARRLFPDALHYYTVEVNL